MSQQYDYILYYSLILYNSASYNINSTLLSAK